MTPDDRLEFIAAFEVVLGAIEDISKQLPQAELREDIFILRDIIERLKKNKRGMNEGPSSSYMRRGVAARGLRVVHSDGEIT